MNTKKTFIAALIIALFLLIAAPQVHAAEYVVRVVDGSGNPISGASVNLVYHTESGNHPANIVHTDYNGYATIRTSPFDLYPVLWYVDALGYERQGGNGAPPGTVAMPRESTPAPSLTPTPTLTSPSPSTSAAGSPTPAPSSSTEPTAQPNGSDDVVAVAMAVAVVFVVGMVAVATSAFRHKRKRRR